MKSTTFVRGETKLAPENIRKDFATSALLSRQHILLERVSALYGKYDFREDFIRNSLSLSQNASCRKQSSQWP